MLLRTFHVGGGIPYRYLFWLLMIDHSFLIICLSLLKRLRDYFESHSKICVSLFSYANE